MNKERRKMIDDAADIMENIAADITTAADEEQEYFDNMPEGLQGSEKGERAEEAAQNLEELATEIEDLVQRIHEAAE